jgi:hypothetical protein
MPCPGFGSGRYSETAGRIDAAGWGLFFLWLGTAFLLDVGWSLGLLGVGILTLLVQVVRRGFGLEYAGFWLFMGGAATIAAVWELAAIDVALGPIVLIACGMMVLVWALRR